MEQKWLEPSETQAMRNRSSEPTQVPHFHQLKIADLVRLLLRTMPLCAANTVARKAHSPLTQIALIAYVPLGFPYESLHER